MPEPESPVRKSRRPIVLGLLFATLGITVLASSVVVNLNHYRVARLGIDMTRGEVEAAVIGRPACETFLGRARVLYFPAPVQGGPFDCSELAREYRTAEDLPLPYGAIVVVLSREGRVSAFWHVGEGPPQLRKRNESDYSNALTRVPLAELER
jgi:hypothetical protein